MELFTPGHLLVLAIVVAFLFFGWKNLPDMSRSVGRSLRIFRTEIKGMGQDDKQRAEADAEAGPPKAIEAPPARAVTPVANHTPAARPRPTPRPTASSDARQTGS